MMSYNDSKLTLLKKKKYNEHVIKTANENMPQSKKKNHLLDKKNC